MLVVIEGTDGSGKETQTRLLSSRLAQNNVTHRKLEFPRYDKSSSALVNSYLNGEFGKNPNDVNAYSASVFYAVDRVASFLSDWKNDYTNGTLILSDRYTTSNATHQGAKFNENDGRAIFFAWLTNFEYVKLGLPRPDCTIFLDIPIEYTLSLMKTREKSDIHETDVNHLQAARESALQAADYFEWNKIPCVYNGKLRIEQDIHEDIYSVVKRFITFC